MKKWRKLLYIFVLAGVLFLDNKSSSDVFAATVYDKTSDNSFSTANNMNPGDTIIGNITNADDLDYYKFQISSAGHITLNMTSYMQYYCIKIFDVNGEEVWFTDRNEWNETIGYRKDQHNVYLEKGTYYMQINGYRFSTYDKSTGRYECVTSFISSNVTNVESDNSFATANTFISGNTIVGQISENDDFDTWKFILSQDGCVKFSMTSYMQYYCIKVFDMNGEEIWYTDRNEWNENVGYRKDSYNLYLQKGTYYMQVNGYRFSNYDKSTGKYVIGTTYTSSNTSFDGNDNSFSASKTIVYNKSYVGQISENDDFDTYCFQVSSSQYSVINMTSYMQYYCVKIFDVNGEEIWYTDRNEWNENVGYREDLYNLYLQKGTYYMQVNGYRFSNYDKSTGKYVFSLAGLNQNNCTHEYKDSTIPATYFSKGYDLHKCEKCGKVYKDNYTTKKLNKCFWRSYYCGSGKGKLYLRWYTVYDASGYQIQYSKIKNMKKGVKTITVKGGKKYSKTISKLSKGKKYYIRIRAYKKSGSKVAFGSWSSKLCIKTKKR